jgi:hypothetical protein
MQVRIVVLALVATAALMSPASAHGEGATERPASPVYPYGLDPTGKSYLPYIGPPDPRIWRNPLNVISETDTQIRNVTREYRAGRIDFEEYLRQKRALANSQE